MKVRCQWMHAAVDRGLLRTIGTNMLAREYGRRKPSGFRLEATRRDYIEGVHIERLEWDDTFEDPAVGEVTVHRVELRRVRFRLSTEGPELELVNPSRSVRSFLGALNECAGSDVVIQSVRVRPKEWLEALEPEMKRACVLTMSTEAITLNAGTAAFVRIEGTDDVRPDLKRLLPKYSPDLERLEVAWESPSGPARCELFQAAKASISVGPAEDLIPFLRRGLRSFTAK